MQRTVGSLLLLLVITGLAVGTSSYSITVADGTDTPDKEVSIEGN
ncbi:MAG: hypothetical protein ABEI52_03965 [Halobacteriaceae archaeon]